MCVGISISVSDNLFSLQYLSKSIWDYVDLCTWLCEYLGKHYVVQNGMKNSVALQFRVQVRFDVFLGVYSNPDIRSGDLFSFRYLSETICNLRSWLCEILGLHFVV